MAEGEVGHVPGTVLTTVLGMHDGHEDPVVTVTGGKVAVDGMHCELEGHEDPVVTVTGGSVDGMHSEVEGQEPGLVIVIGGSVVGVQVETGDTGQTLVPLRVEMLVMVVASQLEPIVIVPHEVLGEQMGDVPTELQLEPGRVRVVVTGGEAGPETVLGTHEDWLGQLEPVVIVMGGRVLGVQLPVLIGPTGEVDEQLSVTVVPSQVEHAVPMVLVRVMVDAAQVPLLSLLQELPVLMGPTGEVELLPLP